MKQKLFILLLAVIAKIGTIFASDISVGGIYYDFNSSTKTAEVTYRGNSYDSYSNEYSGAIVIPNNVTYNGKIFTVTCIGSNAFYNCTGLTSVEIPNSVTSIGSTAFYNCSSLTSIMIPNSVTSIEYGAFMGCSDLSEAIIPNSVTNIGACAFSGCTGLTSIAIPNSVTSIRYCAFKNCSSLTSVTIPNSVTSIGEGAFSGCIGLTSITIPNSVTSIESGAFSGCSSLVSISIPNRVTSIGEGAFSGCTGLTSITIPNSVTSIGNYAFKNCSSLTSVTIPNSVTSIGEGAFENCTGLTSVTIPNSVISIGKRAFIGCTSLTSVTLNSNAIASETYSFNHSLKDIFGNQVTKFLIGDSVTSIGNSAFYDCTSLTSVKIGNSVTNIGTNAFTRCTSLTSITIPNSVISIGNDAFDYCKGLVSVTIESDSIMSRKYISYSNLKNIFGEQVQKYIIGNSVTRIGDYAFYNCSNLTSVTIGNSVTSIGYDAFYGCTGLTAPVYNAYMFARMPCSYSGAYTIPKGIKSIAHDAFSFCTGLTSITIDNSVENIGEYAFLYCTGMTSITIPNSVTNIGQSAFSNCTGLTSITISNSVTSIEAWVFSGCSSLTSVTIGNSVTSIENDAFEDCNALTDVTIHAILPPTIHAYTFPQNSSLKIKVPCESLTSYQSELYWQDLTIVGFGGNCSSTSNYTVSVSSANTTMGIVSGGGTYEEGQTAIVTATPKSGYKFKRWSDGSTANPYSFTVTQNVSLTAYFEQSSTPQQESKFWNISEPVFNSLGTIYSTTTINGLTIYATDAKSVVIDESTQEIDGLSFTHRLKFGGTGASDARMLSFHVDGDCDIDIYLMSASGSADRTLKVDKGSFGNSLTTIPALGASISKGIVHYTGNATTIYLYSPSSGVNIYAIRVTSGNSSEDIENTGYMQEERVQKFLQNGQIYILRGDRIYTLQGQEIK